MLPDPSLENVFHGTEDVTQESRPVPFLVETCERLALGDP